MLGPVLRLVVVNGKQVCAAEIDEAECRPPRWPTLAYHTALWWAQERVVETTLAFITTSKLPHYLPVYDTETTIMIFILI